AARPADYFQRALAREKKGDIEGALADYDVVIRLDPRNAAAYNNRGDMRFRRHELDRALADFEEAIRLDPGLAAAYYTAVLSTRNAVSSTARWPISTRPFGSTR